MSSASDDEPKGRPEQDNVEVSHIKQQSLK